MERPRISSRTANGSGFCIAMGSSSRTSSSHSPKPARPRPTASTSNGLDAGRPRASGKRAVSDFESNRETWDAWSEEYQATKDVRGGYWGVWSIPEAQLDVLGEVSGKV